MIVWCECVEHNKGGGGKCGPCPKYGGKLGLECVAVSGEGGEETWGSNCI